MYIRLSPLHCFKMSQKINFLVRYFVLLLIFVSTLTACDTNKDERRTLQNNLEALSADGEKTKSQIEDIDRRISKIEIEIKEARDDYKANDTEYEKNKLELAKYSMEHKLAVAAAATSATGIVSLLSDLNDDQKAAIAVPTVVAVGYCLFNGDECTDVSARIAFFGTQIAMFKSKTNDAQKRETSSRELQKTIETERQNFKSRIADISAKINILREQINSLNCKFPICI
jgi:chromosome segregation ATPase